MTHTKPLRAIHRPEAGDGPVAAALRADLASRSGTKDDETVSPGTRTAEAAALVLAAALDAGAGLATAAVARQLLVYLQALGLSTPPAADDGTAALLARLSAPVLDTETAGAGHVRAEGGRGRRGTGQAAAPVGAARGRRGAGSRPED